MTKQITPKTTFRKILFYLALFLLSMIFMAPIIWLLQVSARGSLADEPSFMQNLVNFIQNYTSAWNRGGFQEAFVNTIIIGIGAVAFSNLAALPMAYALVRYPLRAKGFYSSFLIFLRILPEMMFLLPLFILFRRFGLFDTVVGMIIAFQIITLPYSVILLRGYIAKVPEDLGNAARVDGCGEWGVLFRITVPAIRSGLTASSILCFIAIWTNLLFPLVLSYSRAQTISIAIANFKGYGSFRWPTMAAGAILSTVPQIILFGLVNKYLVSGLTAGAVKE
jgi:multiple sugar transport system permease protein